MKKYKAAILGCGAIFSRHLAAIQSNSEYFQLIGIFDPNTALQLSYTEQLQIKGYSNEDEVYADPQINCVIILSPSSLHYAQAIRALKHKKHVILEKPATFLVSELRELEQMAKRQAQEIFCILQVRLNPAVITMRKALDQGVLGKVRGISLIQRWQRPLNYFSGWRGCMTTGGGILREFGIHYLDALQHLVGMPQVVQARFFNTKFQGCDVNDTIYALLDFGDFGGSVEISIAAEPKNLECSLSIMGEQGFVKLGGKSLDEIIISDFLDIEANQKFKAIEQEVFAQKVATLATQGASPYHPELYRQIILNPNLFSLNQTYNVIQLVENMYQFK
jgi:UDP-N-acetyl-2-amino-2-deoxyglucuronate dehydrogenase